MQNDNEYKAEEVQIKRDIPFFWDEYDAINFYYLDSLHRLKFLKGESSLNYVPEVMWVIAEETKEGLTVLIEPKKFNGNGQVIKPELIVYFDPETGDEWFSAEVEYISQEEVMSKKSRKKNRRNREQGSWQPMGQNQSESYGGYDDWSGYVPGGKSYTTVYTKKTPPPPVNVAEVEQYFDAEELKWCCQATWDEIKNRFNAVEVGTSKQDHYLFIDRRASILGVAHLDTVVSTNYWGELQLKNVYTHGSKVADNHWFFNGGFDDRLGLYILGILLPKMGIVVDLLLSDNEEVGATTAQYYRPKQHNYNWMVMFDRHSTHCDGDGDEAVFYQYMSQKDWTSAFEKEGFTIAPGSFSCIGRLGHLGICGVNVGTGYQKEHTIDHRLNKDEMFAQVARFASFYRNNCGNKFSFTPPPAPRFTSSEHTYTQSPNVNVTLPKLASGGELPSPNSLKNPALEALKIRAYSNGGFFKEAGLANTKFNVPPLFYEGKFELPFQDCVVESFGKTSEEVIYTFWEVFVNGYTELHSITTPPPNKLAMKKCVIPDYDRWLIIQKIYLKQIPEDPKLGQLRMQIDCPGLNFHFLFGKSDISYEEYLKGIASCEKPFSIFNLSRYRLFLNEKNVVPDLHLGTEYLNYIQYTDGKVVSLPLEIVKKRRLTLSNDSFWYNISDFNDEIIRVSKV